MTLNDLKRQNMGFGFFGDFELRQVYIIHKVKVAPWNYFYAIQIENLVFVY